MPNTYRPRAARFIWNILTGVVLLLALAACDALPIPGVGGAAQPTQPVIVATASPVPEAESQAAEEPTQPPAAGEFEGETGIPEGGETVAAGQATPLPAAEPTEPPRMSAWPLAADFFYLTEEGQVWRQPLTGDETAAQIVTRLDLVVEDFAVAPGGDWLIYRTDEFVAITSLTEASGQLLDNSTGGALSRAGGRTVVWSPDASKMAYTTERGFRLYIPGAGEDYAPLVFDAPDEPLSDLGWSQNAEWLVAWRADGGATLYRSDPTLALWVELGAINGYAWLSNGWLAFAPAEGGLALIDPADLASRVFLVPQDRAVSLILQQPDGALAFFVHNNGVDGPGYLHLADPVDLSLRQESAVPVFTTGYAWDPAASRLIRLTEAGTFEVVDPLTGSTAEFAAQGTPISFDWGDLPPEQVASLPLPADLFFLAPYDGVTQLWRLPADGQPPEPLTGAIADVTAYAVSNDGRQIAYISEGVIYLSPVGTLAPVQVIALDPGAAAYGGGSLDFSPAGTKLAYSNNGIWVIDLETSDLRRLAADTLPTGEEDARLVEVYSHPQWSPDGEWLLVQANYYEGYDFALLAADGSTRTPLPLDLFLSQGRWLDADRLLLYSEGGFYADPALALVSPGQPPQVTGLLDLPVVDVRLRPDGRVALLSRLSPAYSPAPTSVQVYSFALDGAAAGGESPEIDLRAETGLIVVERPLLSPDGVLLAGLLHIRFDEFTGFSSGPLAIVNPATGEVFVIEGVDAARDLRWGPGS